MKIAIFNPYNFEKPGGVQDHVRAQYRELKKRGHTVTILTPRPRKYTDKAPEDTLFTSVSARVRATSHTTDISATMDTEEIDSLFKQHVFDVVHFHEPLVPFVARQLIAQCPYPVVATLHAALPETVSGRTLGSVKPYFRSVLQHVDILTRVSPAAGEYLGEVIEDVDTFFVPNGIELVSYKIRRRPRRKKHTILFIGRLEKRKGPKYLLEAFAELKRVIPEAELIIAGDGPERQRLENTIRNKEMQDVYMLGYISDEEKLALLRTATVACYPALYGESFGIVLIEAMASGIPVIAGRNPGYETVLKNRGSLGLVDPTDTLRFAERLAVFLQDKELQALMTRWGESEVRQYDYTRIVTLYEGIYREAIKKHAA